MFGKKLTAIICSMAMTVSLGAVSVSAAVGDSLIPKTNFENLANGYQYTERERADDSFWTYQNKGTVTVEETEKGKSVHIIGGGHCEFKYDDTSWSVANSVEVNMALKVKSFTDGINVMLRGNKVSDANNGEHKALTFNADGSITLLGKSIPASDFQAAAGKWYNITLKYSMDGRAYVYITDGTDAIEKYTENSAMALNNLWRTGFYCPGAADFYVDDISSKETAPFKRLFTQREILNVDFSQYDEGTTWESLYGAPGGAANGTSAIVNENGKKYMKLTSTGSYFQPEIAASIPMNEKAFVFEGDIRYKASGKYHFQPRTGGDNEFLYVSTYGEVKFGTNNSGAIIKYGENAPWYHVTYYYLFDEQTGVVFFDDGDQILSASGNVRTPATKDITKWGFVLFGGEMDIANMSIKTFDPDRVSKQGIKENVFTFDNVGDKILDPAADGVTAAANAYYGWKQTNTKNNDVIRASALGETVDGRKVVALKDITGTYSEFINDSLGIANNVLIETELRITDSSPLNIQLRGLDKSGASAPNIDSGFVSFAGNAMSFLGTKVCDVNPAGWYRLSIYIDSDAEIPHAYAALTNLENGETFKADGDVPGGIATISRLGFFIPNKPGAVVYIDNCAVSQKGQNVVTEAPADGTVIATNGKLDFAVDLANIDPLQSTVKLNGEEAAVKFDTTANRRVSVSGNFKENTEYEMEYTFKDFSGGSVTGTLDFKTLASYDFAAVTLSKDTAEAGTVEAAVNGRVTAEGEYATFIIAVKNSDGRLLDVELKTIGYSADKRDYTVSADVPSDGGQYTVSAMLWKSNMQPMQKAAEIK